MWLGFVLRYAAVRAAVTQAAAVGAPRLLALALSAARLVVLPRSAPTIPFCLGPANTFRLQLFFVLGIQGGLLTKRAPS